MRTNTRLRHAASAAFALYAVSSLARADAPESPELVVPDGIRVKELSQRHGVKTYQLVFSPGTEVMSTLSAFVLANHFPAAHFEGLGACTDAVLGYYDPTIRDYRRTSYEQQMEIVSIIGDAAPSNGEAGLHIHIGLGFADGTMHGGHLFETHVSPTLELYAVVSPVAIRRKRDPAFNADLLVP